jgi:hypothetical protein
VDTPIELQRLPRPCLLIALFHRLACCLGHLPGLDVPTHAPAVHHDYCSTEAWSVSAADTETLDNASKTLHRRICGSHCECVPVRGHRLFPGLPFRSCCGAADTEFASPILTGVVVSRAPVGKGESTLVYVVFCEDIKDCPSCTVTV